TKTTAGEIHQLSRREVSPKERCLSGRLMPGMSHAPRGKDGPHVRDTISRARPETRGARKTVECAEPSPRRSPRMTRLVVLVALLLTAVPGFTQSRIADDFTITDAMIPARDGVKLHVKLYAPKKMDGPLPIIMNRTPYGVARADRHFASYFREFVKEGYIFAF